MTLDAIGIIFSVSTFVLVNRWGWGILHNPVYVTGLLFLALVYCVFSAFRPDRYFKIKGLIVVALACLMVIAPTISNIANRQHTLAQGFINDSALQIEIAGRYLLLGMNPYTTSYKNTDLAKWDYRDDAGGTNNPALYTNMYPPLLLVASAIEQRILFPVLGWSDIRLLYMAAYLLLIALVFYKWGATEKFILFLAFVLMNPFFSASLTTGTNDVVVFLFLAATVLCMEKRWFAAAGVSLGLAVATKQTAWIATPFIIYYAAKTFPRPKLTRFIVGALATISVFYVPFLLWNTPSLIRSLLLYASTNSASNVPSHPIEGIGFSLLLPALHVVPTIYSKFPFWIFELLVFLGCILAFIRIPVGKTLRSSLWLYIALSITGVGFFSTFFLPPHLAFVLVLFATSYFWQ